MSGQIQPGQTRYLGIINGIVYRIDSTVGTSGTTFGLVPLEMESSAASQGLAATQAIARPPARAGRPRPARASSPAAETPAAPSAAEDVAQVPKAETAATLFPRDGAEPLRAGHPDLWNLLVAGTCLEGSSFRSV